MTEPVLRLEDVTKIYGDGDARVQVLMGIDLRVMPGEYLAIMGPSGSGKSTLLNILGCLDRPTSGEYHLHGEDVAQMEDHELSTIRNERIGFIFQSFNLIPQLNVLENVLVPRLYSRSHGAGSLDRPLQLLESVGLSHRLTHLPRQLSGGESQRVAIARALVNDPVMLLADEPTGNLDSKTGEDVLALMEELHRDGRTIVMISHDPDVAGRAERCLHLKDGDIQETAA